MAQENDRAYADIENRFGYHPPRTPERIEDHENARAQVKSLAHQVRETCPEGREKSLALTKLEEALFWWNAAIARQAE